MPPRATRNIAAPRWLPTGNAAPGTEITEDDNTRALVCFHQNNDVLSVIVHTSPPISVLTIPAALASAMA
jgi:hypothetical protein